MEASLALGAEEQDYTQINGHQPKALAVFPFHTYSIMVECLVQM